MQEAVIDSRPWGLKAAVVALAVCESAAGIALAVFSFLDYRRGQFEGFAESVDMTVGGISTALAIVVILTVASGAFALSRLSWRWLVPFATAPILLIFAILTEPREMLQVKAASIAFFALAVLSWALGTVSYYDDLKG